MRGRLLCLALAVLAATAARAADPTVLVIRSEAEVRGPLVRLGEVVEGPLPAAWADLEVGTAPPPGRSADLSAAILRRHLADVAPGALPRLEGAARCRLHRAGRRAGGADLARRILDLLEREPLPRGVVAQRWRLSGVGARALPRGGIRLASPPPSAGPGHVRVDLGDGAAFHVGVRREVAVMALHAAGPLGAHVELEAARVRADTLWTDRPLDLEQVLTDPASVAGLRTRRPLDRGEVLRRRDLEVEPLVHRGADVVWITARGGVVVRAVTRARGEGARGEWIFVQSPFGRRLTRVQVLAEGVVGSLPDGVRVEDLLGDGIVTNAGGRP